MPKIAQSKICLLLKLHLLGRGFPNWGTCTPRRTFRPLKGYITTKIVGGRIDTKLRRPFFRSLIEIGEKIPLKKWRRSFLSFGLQSNLGIKPNPNWGEEVFFVFNRIWGQNPLKFGRRPFFGFQARFWVDKASFLLQNNMCTFWTYTSGLINGQRIPMNSKLGKPCTRL